MKYLYSVSGMTCNHCKASVEEVLNNIPHVKAAKVDLKRAEVVLEANSHIPIKTLQEVLPEKYGISPVKQEDTVPNFVEQDHHVIKQLFPLFLIFGYIFFTALFLNVKAWNMSYFMLDFMGLFYIVFSFFKFLDIKGFSSSFRMYDPLARTIPVYAWIYPFLELLLGLMFLMRLQIMTALILTMVILGATTIGVLKVLLKKQSIQCACLGTVLKLPMTKATLIENTIMIVMAGTMLIKQIG